MDECRRVPEPIDLKVLLLAWIRQRADVESLHKILLKDDRLAPMCAWRDPTQAGKRLSYGFFRESFALEDFFGKLLPIAVTSMKVGDGAGVDWERRNDLRYRE